MTRPIVKVAGVTGWPIHHSLSPFMHSLWLRRAGIKGAYIPFAVHPEEAEYAFKTLSKTTLTGVNVTTPLKEIAFKAADQCTPDAKKLGVANCLFVRGGKLIAHNTDMEGFAAPLLKHISAQDLQKTTAVILGAGGASRAVIGALLSLGVPEIRLTNRTDDTAMDMAQRVSLPNLWAVPWAQRHDALAGAGLVVNTTSAGMTGKPRLDVTIAYAPETALVYDLIYTPMETRLLRDARHRGMPTVNGLDMLIAQARPSFKIFFGQTPPAHFDPRPALIAELERI